MKSKVKRKSNADTKFTGRCFICGKTNNIQKHHIYKRAFGGTANPRNLVELCLKHHDMYEDATWEEIYNAYILYRANSKPPKLPPRYRTPTGQIVEWSDKFGEYRIWSKFPGGLRNDPFEGNFIELEEINGK